MSFFFQGTGKDQPTMSDWITSMVVVDGNGEIKTIPDDYVTEDLTAEDILKAASVNLGLFGVMVEFTVEVVTMENRGATVINNFSNTLGVSLYMSLLKYSN